MDFSGKGFNDFENAAIVIELLLLPIGYYMVTGGAAYLGIPLMIVGIFGAGLLLAPATRTALGLDHYGNR